MNAPSWSGGLSSYDCFVLRDQNIKSGSYTRLKHLLHCVFWLKRLTEVAIGTFYRDQNCESAIWQLKFSGHNGRRNAHTRRTAHGGHGGQSEKTAQGGYGGQSEKTAHGGQKTAHDGHGGQKTAHGGYGGQSEKKAHGGTSSRSNGDEGDKQHFLCIPGLSKKPPDLKIPGKEERNC